MQSGETLTSVDPLPAAGASKDPEELLSVRAAATEIAGDRASGGVSEATIRRYLCLGKLRRYKFGGRTFIRRGDLAAMVRCER